MLAAKVSFVFIGAAVLTIISGGGCGGNEGGGGGGVVGVGAVRGGTGGGGGEGGGGRQHQRRGCFPGSHRINIPDMEEHCAVILGLVAESGGHRESVIPKYFHQVF
jgi:hypothetical protein